LFTSKKKKHILKKKQTYFSLIMAMADLQLNIDNDGYSGKNDFFGSMREMTTFATERKDEQLMRYLTIVDAVYKLMGDYMEENPIEEDAIRNLKIILSYKPNHRLIANYFLFTYYEDESIDDVDDIKNKNMIIINSVFVVIILEAFLLAINKIPRVVINKIYWFFNMLVHKETTSLVRSLLFAIGNLFVEDSMAKLSATTSYKKLVIALLKYSTYCDDRENDGFMFNRYIYTVYRAINYDIVRAKECFLSLPVAITEYLFPSITGEWTDGGKILMTVDERLNIIGLNMQWLCVFFDNPDRPLYEKTVDGEVLSIMSQILHAPELKPVHCRVLLFLSNISPNNLVPEDIFEWVDIMPYICNKFDAMDDDIDSLDMFCLMNFLRRFITCMQDSDGIHAVLKDFNILQYVCIVMSETHNPAMLRFCFAIFYDLQERCELDVHVPYAIEKSVLRDISSNILNYFETSIHENINNNPLIDIGTKQETATLKDWWQTLHQEYVGGDDVILQNMGLAIDDDDYGLVDFGSEEGSESDMEIEPTEPTEAQPTWTQSTNVADCCVCLSTLSNTAFMKCGHMVTCNACAANRELKTCPVCRSNIDSKVRIYF
jgi:hypothetical protein